VSAIYSFAFHAILVVYSSEWLGSVVVSVNRDREVAGSTLGWPAHHQATTLGKLFTPMCPCHQAVQFGTGQRAVML